MSILDIQTAAPTGLASVSPQIIYILTDDTYAVVTASGYLTAQKSQGYTFSDQQMALVYTSDEGPVWLKIVISYSGSSVLNTVVSLEQISSPGDVTLPTIANHIMVSTDTVGTLANLTGTAISNGSLQAGLSGTAGALRSYPSTAANGYLALTAGNNSGGDFATFITNASSVGQQQTISIPDSGAATGQFVLAQSEAATNAVAFTKVVTIGFSDLAAAATFAILSAPTATSQFAVTNIQVLNSTGLSGGGGDRLIQISDGTLDFNNTGITAALAGTPIFTVWGGTGNPVAAGASQVSTAGDDIYAVYSGGTTDYTAGSIQIAVTFVQVTL